MPLHNPYTHPDISARVYNSAAIATAHNVWKALTFDSERYDTANLHSVVSNTDWLTAPVAGKYAITGTIQWVANVAGNRTVAIYLNGTTFIAVIRVPNAGAEQNNQSISTQYELAAGDYVQLRVKQTCGGALNIDAAGNYTPEFAMIKISG